MASKVKYQYPDEEVQIVDGDDFELTHQYINVTQWQATGKATMYEPHPTYGDQAAWYAYPPVTEKQGSLELVTQYRPGNIIHASYWKHGESPCYHPGFYTDEWWINQFGLVAPAEFNANTKFLLYNQVNRSTYGEDLEDKFHSPVFTHWNACDGDRETTLKITLDGAVKLNRVTIEKVPLFVEIIPGYECPENTCPVICSDTICCYNSDGIAIDSFLKKESIYQ